MIAQFSSLGEAAACDAAELLLAELLLAAVDPDDCDAAQPQNNATHNARAHARGANAFIAIYLPQWGH